MCCGNFPCCFTCMRVCVYVCWSSLGNSANNYSGNCDVLFVTVSVDTCVSPNLEGRASMSR